ncbi:MAG: hypothetical protein ABIJ23_05110 [Candidatus Magasanikbacteria bacterium]
MWNHNKNNFINIPEYRQYSRLRFLSFFIITTLGATTIIGILFIYTNIYNAIGQTQTMLNLNSNLAIELIDFARYDKVDKAWKEKYSDEEIVITRDPFNAVVGVVEIEEEIE